MPDVSFSDWVASLAADTLTGPEKYFPNLTQTAK